MKLILRNDYETARLNLFKALAEKTRYLILKELLNGEKCACEIPKLIGRTQSNTSMHLSKLLENDILQTRRDGKRIFYSIKDVRIKKIFEVLK